MTNTAEVIEFNKQEIAAFSEFRSQLAKLRDDNEKAVFDYADPKGNKEARSHIYKLRQTKAAVERVRKEQKAASLEFGRKVDAQAKEIAVEIDGMIGLHEAPLKEIEEREAARIAAHKERIESLGAYKDYGDPTAAELSALLASAEAFEIDDSLEEFKAEAALAKDDALENIKRLLAARQKYEAEQAELERLRQAEAERAQKEREEQIRKEAEEAARKQAEAKAAAVERERQLEIERANREKAEAEARYLREKQEAEERAKAAAAKAEQDKQAAIEAERQRIEAEAERERQEAERKAANKRHRQKINREALEDLVEFGLSEDQGKQLIETIVRGQVRNVSVNY